MTIYMGMIELPTIEFESSIMGEWFIERAASEQEISYAAGFIINPQRLLDHYCILFNSFIRFEYEDDLNMLELLIKELDDLVYIINDLIDYSICYIGYVI